jgi:hypothetical protein
MKRIISIFILLFLVGNSFAKTADFLGVREVGAAKTGFTNAELVSQAAIRAEGAIGGTGRFAGTTKHTYATTLLKRYQDIYGNRGLVVNKYFNGKFGRGFLDVHDVTNGIIYDFKFGQPFMKASQFSKYSNTFGQPVNIVDRFGSIILR